MNLQETIRRILREDHQFVRKHISDTNPHTGARNAFMGIPSLSGYDWDLIPKLIYPDDKKINKEMLYPASKRDVKRYMKQYIQGSEFPAIVLIDNGKEYSIADGQHRLSAAIKLGVPIYAYVGTEKPKLQESIKINNPSDNEYNEIYSNGEKVGYVILSPARKEYYWLDLNLPNPLAIVDINIYPKFRGKKYMTETMKWLYRFAEEMGYKSLFLRVDDDSEISEDILVSIYQNYGFKRYRAEDDDIFMYKLLNMNLQETIRRILREELYSPAGDKYEPGRYVVHKSAPHWRENIQLTGLQTSVGDCYQLMGIFYGGESVKCKKAIFATDSMDKKDMFHSTYDDDIWLIDTECAGVSWFKDKHFDGFDDFKFPHYHIVTFEDISPDCLKLIHKGTGKNM